MPEKRKGIHELFLGDKLAEADKKANKIMGNCYARICSYENAGKFSVMLHENEVDPSREKHSVKEFTVRSKMDSSCVIELPSTQKNMKFTDE